MLALAPYGSLPNLPLWYSCSGRSVNALYSMEIAQTVGLLEGTSLESRNMSSLREQQFKEIFDKDAAGIGRIANLYGDSEAQDLYQDIAMAIWIALARFRGDCSLRTFAYRIAHNRGSSHLSRRKPFTSLEAELPGSEDVVKDAIRSEQHGQILDALRQLPRTMREVVSLSLEGLTYREISEVIGISENNVGVTLNRGRKKLEELISEPAND